MAYTGMILSRCLMFGFVGFAAGSSFTFSGSASIVSLRRHASVPRRSIPCGRRGDWVGRQKRLIKINPLAGRAAHPWCGGGSTALQGLLWHRVVPGLSGRTDSDVHMCLFAEGGQLSHVLDGTPVSRGFTDGPRT